MFCILYTLHNVVLGMCVWYFHLHVCKSFSLQFLADVHMLMMPHGHVGSVYICILCLVRYV